MITWIICIILVIWLIYSRTREDGKVEGYPLGMPRGSVRALITLLIVSFPFTYLINGQEIPGIITNAIFIVVAFYFEARKPTEDRLKSIIKEIKEPVAFEVEKQKEKKPLYLPKYTVRITLVSLLVLIIVINSYGPQIPFEATNTLLDIMVIIGLYIFGGFFRGIGVRLEKKKIHEQVSKMSNVDSLSKYEILEKLAEEKKSWLARKGKSALSIGTFIATVFALLLYTLEMDPIVILTLFFYQLTLRQILLLVISIYYGFRE